MHSAAIRAQEREFVGNGLRKSRFDMRKQLPICWHTDQARLVEIGIAVDKIGAAWTPACSASCWSTTTPIRASHSSLLLQAKGHQTRIATDGAEAISARRRVSSRTASLLDLGCRAWMATRWRVVFASDRTAVRSSSWRLTGWAGRDVRTKAAEAGFDYHLVKPVNWDELEKIVRSVAVRRRRSRSAR